MTIQRRGFLAAIGGGATAALAGCTALSSDGGEEAGPEIEGETLTLTTTTSTYDTGLLDELNAPFQDRYGVTVDAVAQGTGAALETARNGDSDVVMVHARSLEDEFMENGYGVNRRDLMFNDFVLVGSPDDPAGIEGSDEATTAVSAIAESESAFVSRGDNSGTHTKELAIWDAAGLGPEDFGEWYTEAGQGMGEVLVQADQQGAYTLADRGTYLSMRDELGLEILVQGPIEGGPELLMNPYGIVAVNPAVHDHVNYDLAMAYIGYVTGPEGQEIIENYTSNGEQLFFPEALSENPNFRQYVPEEWEWSDSDDE
ncbi:tungstate transport system substrate-binding protein [Halobiforma haloterrestris]|uniref:Tungstate transport system substrate-binding protein n=1 Tax=Natronobacterium haloterrestre TaxID=148448 RepID=A0A1I1EDS0_NATHA|nr:substrate-binding domain-containing protein [Halobiforma haloterrestris]SFB85197.1 tungstate transport system substrate-binding protein [Halobiforma haloterrestris]